MSYNKYRILCIVILISFNILAQNQQTTITLEQANKLAELPFSCLDVEYPNKLNQTLNSQSDIQSPSELHPTFYGCFDWHSSVHGHWSLIALLKQFPKLNDALLIRQHLIRSITKEKIVLEVQYFEKDYNKSFERTYGWAWILKLANELHTWDDPLARELENNLQLLTSLIVKRYIDFLPKLNYPIRVGEHTNTAFGLSFAYEFATTVGHDELKNMIAKRVRDFYMNDQNCPISWEPSGYDFLSPCLEEMDIMRRVLTKKEFKNWIKEFLPQLSNKEFELAVGEVSDRADGKLVHLDGLNFSRAWCLLGLANQFEEYEHLKDIAKKHINYSLPSLFGDNYEGSHWLGSFAIYSLKQIKID